MSAGESPLGDPVTVLFVGAGMFFPAIGVAITRLLTGEGFRNAWIRPVHFRQTWRYYLIGWFGPIALVTIGAIAYFALNPGQFDTSMSSFAETARQMESAGQPITMSSSQIAALGYAQLALVIVAPLLNCVSCFGEEWGWRGYLLPHLSERYGVRIAVPVSGIIWGLWHAPVTVLGHNYGLGYPGWPIIGILAMCCLCVALSYLFSWLTFRAKSCLPAVFAHGALNGCSAAPLMFMAGTGPTHSSGPHPRASSAESASSSWPCSATFRSREDRRRDSQIFIEHTQLTPHLLLRSWSLRSRVNNVAHSRRARSR